VEVGSSRYSVENPVDADDGVELRCDAIHGDERGVCPKIECGRGSDHCQCEQAGHAVHGSSPDEEHAQAQVNFTQNIVEEHLSGRLSERSGINDEGPERCE